LGLTVKNGKYTFKVWSPASHEVRLMLYNEGSGGKPFMSRNLKPGKQGEWSITLRGKLEGKFYAFQIYAAGTGVKDFSKTSAKGKQCSDCYWHPESPDPYAFAVGVNGERAMIIDFEKTNPPGWKTYKKPPLKSFSDIILYELHFRDLSIHPSSGIRHKSKYLGLAETGTKTPGGNSTGLDHIRDLGITHVHLLPSFDFLSVDEKHLEKPQFNWGYDPLNYSVPEGSYSTNPFDGSVRIAEFKQMVKTLHEHGLRVILDVVYNHTGSTEQSVFNRIAPYYYYRLNEKGKWSDAAACGNETASERFMMRKYMLESMLHWAKEYHIDGFRVDLMGIHDIETMNLIAKKLQEYDPSIFIYGEGWTAGASPLPDEQRALKINTHKLIGIAAFSDELRDGVKGHVFTHDARGFATGEPSLDESVKFGIVGAIKHPNVNNAKVNYSKEAWANAPYQCINYVSCHDNHTLYDRLVISNPGIKEPEILKLIKLTQTIVLTSQGVPFLHAAEEITRTKFGVENSFKSPDSINQIVWSNKDKHLDLFEYHKALIQMRKNHPAFRMPGAEQVRKHLEFLQTGNSNIISYLLKDNANGDSWKRIFVAFNGNKAATPLIVPAGKWRVICQEGKLNEKGLDVTVGGNMIIAASSALILAEE
jgi:pullulanase